VAQDVLCPNNICGGYNGSQTVLTSKNLPTLEFANSGGAESGTAYVVVLIPSTTNLSLSFSVNGNASSNMGLWTGSPSTNVLAFLSLATSSQLDTPTGNDNFAFLQSASGQAVSTPSSFNVYVVKIGSFTATTPLPLTFAGLDGVPPAPGTVFWGYLFGTPPSGYSCSSGSSCVNDIVGGDEAVVVTPEPGTLALVGTGLLLLAGAIRRKLS
jgi:hypothetical protein